MNELHWHLPFLRLALLCGTDGGGVGEQRALPPTQAPECKVRHRQEFMDSNSSSLSRVREPAGSICFAKQRTDSFLHREHLVNPACHNEVCWFSPATQRLTQMFTVERQEPSPVILRII